MAIILKFSPIIVKAQKDLRRSSSDCAYSEEAARRLNEADRGLKSVLMDLQSSLFGTGS